METIRAEKICAWTQGKLLGNPEATADKVGTDSRTVEPGSLFVAIRGEKFDGHSFLGQAFEKGAAAVLSEVEITPPNGCAAVVVDDTVKALGNLARNYLKTFELRSSVSPEASGKPVRKR